MLCVCITAPSCWLYIVCQGKGGMGMNCISVG